MTAGLVQLSVSDDPERNLPVTRALIREAAQGGADWVLTPEATNLLG
ncbi:carbon-nitrogen hydrolase family protein, partial [Paracoccus sp. PXZ]